MPTYLAPAPFDLSRPRSPKPSFIPRPATANYEQEVKDSRMLSAILRFCYPCTLGDDPNIDIQAFSDAIDVLEAAREYSLEAVGQKARQVIANRKFFEAEPLRCFAIAHRRHLPKETVLAARHTLRESFVPSWFQEIELLAAADLFALLSYHRKCGDAVYALRSDLSWITSHYGSSDACFWLSGRRAANGECCRSCGCRCRRAESARYTLFDSHPLGWWEDFMDETFAALRDKPCEETVKACAIKTVESVKAQTCQACSLKITEGMRAFVDLFAKKVEGTVSQIELELNF